MTFTKQQQREYYSKLPSEIRSFIFDYDTSELIDNYLTQEGIIGDNYNYSDSEILYALYELQTLDEAIKNISQITGRSLESLTSLKSNLQTSIFDKIYSLQQISIKVDPVIAKKKVSEIVNKYGLSSSQATVLENEVMSVIERNLGEKITTQDLTNLLNISNLLAEQIVYELEARVFERGVKVPEKPKMSVEPTTKPEPVVSFGNTTLNVPKEMMKPAFQNEALDSQKTSTSTSIGVPRYATEDIYKPTQPASNPIVNNKLNTVTPGIRPIETKYQKDPYREPLE